MLDEKKKLDIEKMRIAGYLNQGGQLDTHEDEDGEYQSGGLAGIDYPVGEGNIL